MYPWEEVPHTGRQHPWAPPREAATPQSGTQYDYMSRIGFLDCNLLQRHKEAWNVPNANASVAQARYTT